MSVIILLLVLGVVCVGVSVFSYFMHKSVLDEWGMLGGLAAIAAAALFVSTGIVIVTHNLSIEASRKECAALADGRDAKFVEYNYFSWDCLVKSTKGRYIPVGDVKKIELENGDG